MQYFSKIKPKCQHAIRQMDSRTQALALRLPLLTCTRQREADRQVCMQAQVYKDEARCRMVWVHRTGLEGVKDPVQTRVLLQWLCGPGASHFTISLTSSLLCVELGSLPPPGRAVGRITKDTRVRPSAFCLTQKQPSGKVSSLPSYLGYIYHLRSHHTH